MSQMEIYRVLAQIRSIAGATKAGGIGGLGGAAPTAPGAADSGFANLLKQGIEKVNETQFKANTLATQFEKGVPGVELPRATATPQFMFVTSLQETSPPSTTTPLPAVKVMPALPTSRTWLW